jgi:signal transduction histidine kinase
VRGLEATSAISRAVGFETELERVLELIAKRGRAATDARSFLVLLEDGDVLRVVAEAGEIGTNVLGAEVPVAGTLPGSVLGSGQGEMVPELGGRIGTGLDAICGDATSAVVSGLGFRGRGRGALVALDRLRDGPAFDRDDEYLLSSFAASASIAIATAQSVGADKLQQSMRAAESERTRWARELHDETLQELGALKLALESAQHHPDPAVAGRTMGEAIGQVDMAIRNLQGLITELRPAALDELGLQPALEALVERTSATSGLGVYTEIDLGWENGRRPTRLVPELEGAIYRLAQEALTNVIKHAGAEEVRVRLTEDAGIVRMTVADNGSGFDADGEHHGFGLVGMRERAELVGGRLAIESEPGDGTTVRAELPAQHIPEADGHADDPAARLTS